LTAPPPPPRGSWPPSGTGGKQVLCKCYSFIKSHFLTKRSCSVFILIFIYFDSGSYAPPVTSSQGALDVTLTTDEVLPSVAGPLSGFQAYYIANGACRCVSCHAMPCVPCGFRECRLMPSFATDPTCGSCGRSGYCDPVSKQCVCFSGAIGTKCNATASTANATALARDEMINGIPWIHRQSSEIGLPHSLLSGAHHSIEHVVTSGCCWFCVRVQIP
jgi:hypothetical protein